MDFDYFHFAQPLWLWGLLAIPGVWMAFYFLYRSEQSLKHLEAMIDSHLLPFLLIKGKNGQQSSWKARVLAWSIIWTCFILALAGPRWNFRDIEMMSKDQSLVILLDLSESMNATDVKPSRLVRARQKIEDLLQNSQGVKIGVVAFAADPHMITPLTEDKENVRHLLPSLTTDLVFVQGSKLSPALGMASKMLDADPGRRQAIVVISDGGFEDNSAIAEVKRIAEKGVNVHAIGVGTAEGAILQDSHGSMLKKNGKPVLSKLQREPLQEISRAGQGFYIEPRFSNHDESAILAQLQTNAEAISAGKTMRLWEEGFFVFLIPVIPLLLYWFRKGIILPVVAWVLLGPSSLLQAGIVQDYFMNSEQNGAHAYKNENYEDAAQAFQDPYRKGVSFYKAGRFAEAAGMFKQSAREDVARDAGYNLGNALAKQQKFQEALSAYEDVLKKWPDHQPTKDNLEIIKKILEQQKQEQPQEQKQQDQKDNTKKNDNKDSSSGGSNESSEEKEQSEKEKNPSESSQEGNQPENASPEDKENRQNQENKPQESEQPSSGSENEQKEQEQPAMPQDNNEGKETDGSNPEENKDMAAAETPSKSSKDMDADVWLNRLTNDPKSFLKNKFYLESKKNGTREGIDPW